MASITSAQSGLASATSTWVGGVVPVQGDKVTIAAGHTVTLDGARTWGDDTATAINVNGTLKADRAGSSTLTCRGHLLINSGGSLDYGKESDPIPGYVSARIVLNNSAAMAAGKWGLETKDNAGFWLFGAAKTVNSRLTADVAAGATVVDVADASGWRAGDRLVFATTDTTLAHSEERLIASVSGNQITLQNALTWAHANGGYIGNFTHSVVITSHDPAFPAYVKLWHGSAQTHDSRELQYALVENVSPNNNGPATSGISFSSDGATSSRTRMPYKRIANLSIRGVDGAPRYALCASYARERLTFENVAIHIPGYDAMFFGSGATCDVKKFVVYACGSFFYSAYSQGGQNCRFYDCVGYGSNVFSTGASVACEFYRCLFPLMSSGIVSNCGPSIRFSECKFGVGGPGACALTSSVLNVTGAQALVECTMRDCQFAPGASMINIGSLAILGSGTKLVVANKNLDPLQQEIYTPAVFIFRDNTFARDASGSSLRMEPKSATSPGSFSLKVFAPNGLPVVVSGYLYKSAAYGPTTQPTVALSGLGVSDAWTMPDVADQWVQFKVAATQTSGANGMLDLTFTVQSGGAGAAVWVDGVVAPTPMAVSTGDFGVWTEGLPAPIITANFVAAADVWSILTSQLTLDGSAGKALVDLAAQAAQTAQAVDDVMAVTLAK